MSGQEGDVRPARQTFPGQAGEGDETEEAEQSHGDIDKEGGEG